MKKCWNVKLSEFSWLILILIAVLPAIAQKGGSPPSSDEEDYYIFPVNPGERGSLSGTMGELRSTHFHSGIDIRTGGRTGIPIVAAADGEIVRVAVSTSGYGNALYIRHPNNTFTVYAHLEKFEGPIADYVREQQYKRKQWDIDLYPSGGQFPVRKGEKVALSGNSGSSGGPHLHFDIRDGNHNVLNPLKYNFEEVWDRTPPVARALALKPMNRYSRVNNIFNREEYSLRRVGNDYVIDKPIPVYGVVGLELYAYDLLDNSRFRTGITEIDVYLNGEKIHRQEINTFSFSDQRNILVHMPYEELQKSGQRFHKLYIDDGNRLSIYDSRMKNGLIFNERDCEYPVEIVMKDTYNNESKVSFTVVCRPPQYEIYEPTSEFGHSGKAVEILNENVLKIKLPREDDKVNRIVLYDSGEETEIGPDYITETEAVYLWDMRNGLPDSADYCSEKRVFNYHAMIPSEKQYHFYGDNIAINFPVNSLFDTLYLQTKYAEENGFEKFTFGNPTQPVRRYLNVTLIPEKEYDPRYYSVYSLYNDNLYHSGGKWKDNTITFSTRDFGTYTIAADSVAPDIKPLVLNSNDLKFRISDSMSGINDYELTIDGEWVMMHYDYKRNLIWSEKLKEDVPFSGEVRLRVTDNQGNVEIYTTSI